jgi:hypothetical protein
MKRKIANRAELKAASKLYSDFTGNDEPEVVPVKVRSLPKTALAVGTILGVIYETVRDGEKERYIHQFKARSRPLFAVSHDGKQLLMLGGAYDFTDRGIVDRS